MQSCGSSGDQLNYYYKGNKLIGVNDDAEDNHIISNFSDNGHKFVPDDNPETQEYFYDDNGNMTRDINKGIEHIEYNFLNLPKTIEFENGDYIIYYYDASGIKLRKEIYHNNELITNIDYICNTVYKNNKLDFILTEEGRIKKLENNSFR